MTTYDVINPKVTKKILKYCGNFKAMAAAIPAVAKRDIDPNELGFLPFATAMSNLLILKNICHRVK